jgi:flagellar basal body-associated protein FliL
MEQQTPPTTPKGRSNTALLALVVLLLISNVVMVYMLMQKDKAVESTGAQLTAVTSEKDNVTKLLEDMLSQYDTLNTENEQLRTEMDAQRQQIEDLMEKVKNGSYSLSKAKKEAETLRKIMKGYVVTIDSLNQANQALTAENLATKQQLGEVTGQKQALEQQTADQKALIAKGAVLHTTAHSAGALFLRNSGKQVDTDRASKAEMVKSCFTLGENRVTNSGNKVLYMRIISPDGSVLPANDADNRFTFNGVQGEFSVKREVNYQNQPVDVCMFYTAAGKLATGQYIVEIYESGSLVSKTTFDLK